MAYGVRDKMAIASVAVACGLGLFVLIEANSSRDRVSNVERDDPLERALAIDAEAARKRLARDVEREPDHHRHHYDLARAHEKLEHWGDMVAALREATRLAPEFANYWWKLGYASMRLGKYDLAREALRMCVEKDKNFVECHHDLGVLHQTIDNPRRALLHYVDAINTDPRHGRSYVEAASLYFALGRHGEAEAVAKAGLDLLSSLQIHHGDRCELHELLADVARLSGDAAGERAQLERGHEISESVALDRCSTIAFRLGYAFATMKPPNIARASALLSEFRKRQCTKYTFAKVEPECIATTALLEELDKTGRR